MHASIALHTKLSTKKQKMFVKVLELGKTHRVIDPPCFCWKRLNWGRSMWLLAHHVFDALTKMVANQEKGIVTVREDCNKNLVVALQESNDGGEEVMLYNT